MLFNYISEVSLSFPHNQNDDVPIFFHKSAPSSVSSMSCSDGATRYEPAPANISVAQALELARDSPEGAQDPVVVRVLETEISVIWGKIQLRPDWYIMSRNEFAVFNYFQSRFEGQKLAVLARARYWDYQQHLNGAFVMFSQLREASGVLGSHKAGLDVQGKVPHVTIYEKNSMYNVSLNEEGREQSKGKTGGKWKIAATMLVGCFVGLGWLLMDCASAKDMDKPETYTPTYHNLVRNAATVSTSTAAPKPTGLLEVFQVYQPVLAPSGAVDETISSDGQENTTTIATTAASSSCEVLLMKHDFAYSYGEPFVGNYTPPSCKFNRVTMNFTVTVKGRQFDRLALMYFGDTEVWRTSTAEPTTNGIIYTYIKDMTEYMYFWNSPQTLIFDLGNLIDSTYTGIFNTTLTATFFTSQETVEPADLIIPISARNGATDSASVFTLPSDNATNTISFPQNANRAVFAVSACGQATEEFWWSNVLSSDVETFENIDGTLYGYSPFREVQILIDGQLAGVQWPYPVIFTGGVVPGLWRPIVGIDAFDLREHEIDITPWLPLLCNGKEHTFEIKVVGVVESGERTGTLTETVGSSWYVTGKIFVYLDEDADSVTTGTIPTVLLPSPVISLSQYLTQDATGANETLSYTTDVKRQLSISSSVKSQSGTKIQTWTQSLTATNYGLYTAYGAIQQNNQSTIGDDISIGGPYYRSSYSYPLFANTTYATEPDGSYSFDATVIRSLDLAVYGTPIFPSGLQPFAEIPKSQPLVTGFSGSQLSTTQSGIAYYFANATSGTSTSFGNTTQEFTFSGIDASAGVTDVELYYRNVEAVNATVVRDQESLIGEEFSSFGYPAAAVPKAQVVLGAVSPKQALGRGPGSAKQVLIGS